MAIHSAVALFALTLLCSSSLAYSQVDYFRLLVVWPGGFCNNPSGAPCCRPGIDNYPRFDFYVNRLIPYTRNAPRTGCRFTPFDINTLQSIIGDMNSYWPSINCPSSDGQAFWESVWRADGICSGLGQKDYFQKALELRKKANLLDILDWKGILPSNYKTYQLAEVLRAITETYGETASIECGSPPGESIKGIYLCVDNTATNIIKCPFNPTSNCAARVKFDPYMANMLKDQAISAIPTLKSVISE